MQKSMGFYFFFLILERSNIMDWYHLFKLGTCAAKAIKYGKSLEVVKKPIAILFASGMADSALDDITDKFLKENE